MADFQTEPFLLFIRTLFAQLGVDEFIEIRCIVPGNARPRFYPTYEALVADLKWLTQAVNEANVYVGVCPRCKQAGDKNAVKGAFALWVDLDAKAPAFGGDKGKALDRLTQFSPLPSLVVDSGNGYHGYWLLQEPVFLLDASAVRQFELVLKELAQSLGADTAVAEVARVMRVPGTVNRKDAANLKPALLIECHSERLYELAAFQKSTASPQPALMMPGGKDWFVDALGTLGEDAHNRHSNLIRVVGELHRQRIAPDRVRALLSHVARTHNFPVSELDKMVADICAKSDGQGAGAPKPVRVEKLADFLTTASAEIEWRVEGVFPKEGTGLLVGTAGAGKTWLLADLAVESARGGKWLGQFQTKQSTVLVVDEESSVSLLQRRLARLLTAKELEPGELPLHLAVGQEVNFSRPASVGHLRDKLEELKPGLVIVDSLIRVHQADENDAAEMSRVFAVVKSLVQAYGCTFVFADHVRKHSVGMSAGDLVRGSTDKMAFADSVLTLRKEQCGLTVDHTKSRHAEAIPAFLVEIKDTAENCTVVRHVGDAETQREEARQREAREFVLGFLKGRDWTARQVLVDQAKGAAIGKKVLDEVLKSLTAAGLLEREDRKPEQGKGGKQAFYRLKDPGTPSPAQPSKGEETETESGGSGGPTSSPSPHLPEGRESEGPDFESAKDGRSLDWPLVLPDAGDKKVVEDPQQCCRDGCREQTHVVYEGVAPEPVAYCLRHARERAGLGGGGAS